MSSLPGMRESELTREAKAAIDQYLEARSKPYLWVAKSIGIITLVGFVTSLSYIFFVLPNQAASKAFTAWQSKFARYENEIEEILQGASRLELRTELVRDKTGEVQENLLIIEQELRKAKSKTSMLLGDLSNSDVARAAMVVSNIDAETAVQAEQLGREALDQLRRLQDEFFNVQGRLNEIEALVSQQVKRTHALEKAQRQPAGRGSAVHIEDATGSSAPGQREPYR